MTVIDFVLYTGAGYGYGLLCWDLAGIILEYAKRLNEWSHRRAIIKCGQAILDYEWDKSGNPVAAHRFAHKVMGTEPGRIG